MIYSIGHSTLPIEDFIKLMKDNNIDVLMDIRSHPTSRWEQHRKENYERSMPEAGIAYYWEAGLGGWDVRHMGIADLMAGRGVNVAAYTKGKFPKQQIAPKLAKEVSPLFPSWTNRGLFEYSWFTTLEEFGEAVDRLIFLGERRNVAIMCCEVLWWKCHRSMVADYLWSKGIDSVHLQPKLTNHSKAIGNRLERYHPDIIQKWDQFRFEHTPVKQIEHVQI